MVCVKYRTFHNTDHMTKREAEPTGVGLFCGIVSQMSEPNYTVLHLEPCDHRHQNITLWRGGNSEKGTSFFTSKSVCRTFGVQQCKSVCGSIAG